ncbi:MAG TPA: hypothetical protein VFP93_01935, partial [Gammaproteobacteria bacterium]|nr:hypothetical protein [Gammaproteobacteria bacterium]
AEPSIRFDATSFLALLQKFRKYGYLEDAEKILKVLIQQNKTGKMDEILAREQLLLARCFYNKSDILKAKHTLEWCKEVYPQTSSAKEAKKLAMY